MTITANINLIDSVIIKTLNKKAGNLRFLLQVVTIELMYIYVYIPYLIIFSYNKSDIVPNFRPVVANLKLISILCDIVKINI